MTNLQEYNFKKYKSSDGKNNYLIHHQQGVKKVYADSAYEAVKKSCLSNIKKITAIGKNVSTQMIFNADNLTEETSNEFEDNKE